MLKLLCVADPRDSHQHRYLDLLTREKAEIHLLDQSSEFQDPRLPIKTRSKWPRSGRRTITRIAGSVVGDRIADLAIKVQLQNAWRRIQPQICHVHWLDERAWHCAMAGLHPLVLSVYGSDLNSTMAPNHDPQLLKKKAEAISHCDLFIADSEDMIARATDLAGCAVNSLLLPIGIDTQIFRPGYDDMASEWRCALEIPEHVTVILSPRIMTANYRHEEIMRAFSLAMSDGGIDAYIVFKKIWCNDNCVEQVRAIAVENGVLDRVRIIDGVAYERLPVLYSMADFAVNFPAMDAFPVTFLECAACELPILSNRLPAYSSNGMGKYLTFAEKENEHALSQKIVAMCNGAIDYSLVREARAHVVRYFDESSFITTLISAYESLLTRWNPVR